MKRLIYRLGIIQLCLFMLMPPLYASCGNGSEQAEFGGEKKPNNHPLLGGDISGERYDYTITGKPERPYLLTYHDKMMMKMMMSEKIVGGGTNVIMTYSDVLDNIKAIDNLTRGIQKIVYLVGWQFDGHDSKYPAFDHFNEALKREGDSSAKESYFWLKKEAEKYNTIVSVHINMNDAYMNSPLWTTYVRNDLISKNADGSFLQTGTWGNESSYNVCFTHEWEKGYAQKRIDEIIELLDLTSAKTVHIDVFLPYESPYHGISLEDESRAMRKILRYWREKGVDVTTECWYFSQRVDQFIGLQPAVWWNDMTSEQLSKISPSLACGGQCRPGWGNDKLQITEKDIELTSFLFGSNMHGEDLINKNTDYNKFRRTFCLTTLPWSYLNQHRVDNFDKNEKIVTYSEGLVVDGENKKMTKNGYVVRENNDLFIPVTWNKGQSEIIAYSEKGYKAKKWTLPSEWENVKTVKVSYVSRYGLENTSELPVDKGTITINMSPDVMLSIQPQN